jgi:hypothetical protein
MWNFDSEHEHEMVRHGFMKLYFTLQQEMSDKNNVTL